MSSAVAWIRIPRLLKKEIAMSSRGKIAACVATSLAVDELMDMARTSINVVGNCVASVVVARWEGVLRKPLELADEDAPAAELAESGA